MTKIITEGLPAGIPLVTTFNHPIQRLDYYHKRLLKANVTVPETYFYNVGIHDGTPVFNEGPIAEMMCTKGWRQAFLRSMYASAKFEPREGSQLSSQDRVDIRETVAELIAQHIRLGRPTGKRIAVRKWLDLDYCPIKNHHHITEVRYFIENGEILYRAPDRDSFENSSLSCDETYDYVREDVESGITYPDRQALRVAKEFDTYSWSVDFMRDAKSGTWYCCDMGLNGLYWNEEHEQWIAISEHHKEGHNPENLAHKLDESLKP